ncbi:hypothetical protein VCR15J2_470499 [Vibrio coralliirubri]|uniref:Ig-like domain-containing protein n=1 Tax=Vibrio coralliirubri TaxID=1516159 RepID=UPI0006361E13|nr:Ig-like domain-containing protein [Vibrio coralliirubri]CDT67600.1 hypothetical protein VCR15J2_470499 [Vibrio coralliirubri]
MNNIIVYIFLLIGMFALQGCNEKGTESTVGQVTESVEMSAQIIVPINKEKRISLGEMWPSMVGHKALSYKVLTGNVEGITLGPEQLLVTMSQVGSAYVAITFDNQATGYLYISAAEIVLPPVLRQYTLAPNTTATLRIDDLLPTGLPSSNFSLMPVVGAQQGQVKHLSTATLGYTAPLLPGIDVVNYAFTDGAAVINGQLHIIVTSQTNKIDTDDFSLSFDGVGVSHSVDLTPYIRSQDNSRLQLIALQVSGGTATPSKPHDPYNTMLNFQASLPGVYQVLYTVTDHDGSYGQGVIELTLTDSQRLPPAVTSFSLLRQQGPSVIFDLDLAPYIQTSSNKINLVGLHQVGSTVTGAQVTVKQAEGGNNKLGPVVTVDYPGNQSGNISFSFAVKDELGFQSAFAVATIEYLPSLTFTQVTANPSQVIADGLQYATVTAEIANAAGAPIPNIPVRWQASANTLFDTVLQTDSKGKATVKIKGKSTGAVTVDVSSGSLTGQASVEFLVSPSINRIKGGVTITADNAVANGSDHNQATVTVVDINDDPVQGVPVYWQTSSTVNLQQRVTMTNSQGIATAIATSRVRGRSTLEVMLNSESKAQEQWSFQGNFNVDSINVKGNLDHGGTISPNIGCTDCDLNNMDVQWIVDLNDSGIFGDTVVINGQPVSDPTYLTPSYSVKSNEYGKKVKLIVTVPSSDGSQRQTESAIFLWDAVKRIYVDDSGLYPFAETTGGAIYGNDTKTSFYANGKNPYDYKKLVYSLGWSQHFSYAINNKGRAETIYLGHGKGVELAREPEAASGVLDLFVREYSSGDLNGESQYGVILYKQGKLVYLQGDYKDVHTKYSTSYSQRPVKLVYESPLHPLEHGVLMVFENDDGSYSAVTLNAPPNGFMVDIAQEINKQKTAKVFPRRYHTYIVLDNYIYDILRVDNKGAAVDETNSLKLVNPFGNIQDVDSIESEIGHDRVISIFSKARNEAYMYQSPHDNVSAVTNPMFFDNVKKVAPYVTVCGHDNLVLLVLTTNQTVLPYPKKPIDYQSEYDKLIDSRTDIVDINVTSSSIYPIYQTGSSYFTGEFSACRLVDQSPYQQPIIDWVKHKVFNYLDVSYQFIGDDHVVNFGYEESSPIFESFDGFKNVFNDSTLVIGNTSATEAAIESLFDLRNPFFFPKADFNEKVVIASGKAFHLTRSGEVKATISTNRNWLREFANIPDPSTTKIWSSLP